MKIAVAQFKAVKGNVEANLASHKELILLAAKEKADAVFFSELSLTSYEPSIANDFSNASKDIFIDEFTALSNQLNITLGIGMPTKSPTGIHISMLIFQAQQEIQIYSKQELHPDEFPFFKKGNQQIIISLEQLKIAPAICFESLQASHAIMANKLGANVYLASVAKSQAGIDKANEYFPKVAKSYSMPVLMSNCTGFCDNFESAGQSAVWSKDGVLLAQLDATSTGILVFDTETQITYPSLRA